MDVIVVGSGPAAHLAALMFQDSGRRTALIRRPSAAFPDWNVVFPAKPAGRISPVLPENSDIIQFIEVVRREDKITFDLPDELKIAVSTKGRLCGALEEKFLQSGGTLREGRYESVDHAGQRVTVAFSPVEGKGRNAVVGNLLVFCPEWESIPDTDQEAASKDSLSLFLISMELPEGNSAGSLIIDLSHGFPNGTLVFRHAGSGFGTVGCCGSYSDVKTVKSAMLESLSVYQEWAGAKSLKSHETSIPLHMPKAFHAGRSMLAGHSAGLSDTLSGIGIYPALRSAVECVSRSDSSDSDRVMDSYRRTLLEEFQRSRRTVARFSRKYLADDAGRKRLFRLLRYREAQCYFASLLAGNDPGLWTATLWGKDFCARFFA